MTAAQPGKLDSRIRELAHQSAGRAAQAFGQLLGRACQAREPRVCEASGAATAGRLDTGIVFEMHGAVQGVVALLLSRPGRDAVLGALGARPPVDSALREVGNIVASHAVSAVADQLGVRITLSVPTLVRADAGGVLDRLLARRASAVVTTTEFRGLGPDLDALLVFAAEA